MLIIIRIFLLLQGPLKVFNARRQWTAPRLVQLQKGDDGNFGFSVRGDSPVIVAAVDHGSVAQVRAQFELPINFL